MSHYDIEFFWDPVCPFAWITSRWITKVSAQTGYKVDWRFISLRLLNKHKAISRHEYPRPQRLRVAWMELAESGFPPRSPGFCYTSSRLQGKLGNLSDTSRQEEG